LAAVDAISMKYVTGRAPKPGTAIKLAFNCVIPPCPDSGGDRVRVAVQFGTMDPRVFWITTVKGLPLVPGWVARGSCCVPQVVVETTNGLFMAQVV